MQQQQKIFTQTPDIQEPDMLANDMLNDRRVDIQKIDDLPPLPIIANELLAALNDPDSEIEDISEIIIKDPGLTAKLLGLANSAFFGFGRPVNNITDAIINVLGLDLVKGLSIGLIMGNSFDVNKCKGFDIARYWSNSLLTANLTKDMAVITDFENNVNPGFMYLYGLLHNIGVLVMADCFADEMGDVFLAHDREPELKLISIENERLGINHHQAGYYLAEKWELPQDICITIKQYTNFDYRDLYFEQAQLTGYCSRLTQNWLQGSTIEPKNELIPSLLNISMDKAEDIINKNKNKIDDLNSIAANMTNK